jgi:hypothetical protein
MIQNLSRFGLVALALGMVALGLVQVGGPETARQETRDEQRLQDLIGYANHLSCVRAQKQDPERFCGVTPIASDRFTNVPFEIRGNLVCAAFESGLDDDQVAQRFGVSFSEGCVSFDAE